MEIIKSTRYSIVEDYCEDESKLKKEIESEWFEWNNDWKGSWRLDNRLYDKLYEKQDYQANRLLRKFKNIFKMRKLLLRQLEDELEKYNDYDKRLSKMEGKEIDLLNGKILHELKDIKSCILNIKECNVDNVHTDYYRSQVITNLLDKSNRLVLDYRDIEKGCGAVIINTCVKKKLCIDCRLKLKDIQNKVLDKIEQLKRYRSGKDMVTKLRDIF